MLSLPEIESVVMQQCSNEPRTAMLLYNILEYAREADHEVRIRDERIRQLESLLVPVRAGAEFSERAGSAVTGAPECDAAQFSAELERILQEAQRHGDTGLLALVRLENPLSILEQHGAPALAKAFEHLNVVLRDMLRTSDPLVRCDEGTFACVLTRCEPEAAMLRLLDTLRTVNAEPLCLSENETVALKVGFGTAAYDRDGNVEDLFAQAEEALLVRSARRRNELTVRYQPRVPVYEAA